VPVGGAVEAHEDVDHHDAGDGYAGTDEAGVTGTGAVATATIAALGGSGVSGTVTFTELGPNQLRVEYAISGLEPGAHGFHVHENGSCATGDDGTPGGAAGGHFNPDGDPHGGPDASAEARHVGDFGNIVATERGMASGSFTDNVARLGGPDGISGKALVIHAGEDDLQSQPTGDAGGRVGCGIIAM
jgi:Cu-Zn family superoxide dismutase